MARSRHTLPSTRPPKVALVLLLALLLLPVAPARATGEPGSRLLRKDGERPWYTELGLDVARPASPLEAFPTSEHVSIGPALSAGYWLRSFCAVEVGLAYATGVARSEAGGGRGERHDTSLRAGVRLALPFVVSPVAAFHTGYALGQGTWEVPAEGSSAPLAGHDVRHAWFVDAAAGLQLTIRWLTVSALFHARMNLVASTSREVDEGSLGNGAAGSVKNPETGDLAGYGLEARIGVRF